MKGRRWAPSHALATPQVLLAVLHFLPKSQAWHGPHSLLPLPSHSTSAPKPCPYCPNSLCSPLLPIPTALSSLTLTPASSLASQPPASPLQFMAHVVPKLTLVLPPSQSSQALQSPQVKAHTPPTWPFLDRWYS